MSRRSSRRSAGGRSRAIICTHTHRDHSPASRPLARATGAPIIGCAPLALENDGPRADAAFDFDYAPDRVLADGEAIGATAGRCGGRDAGPYLQPSLLRARRRGALFTGDHVMGWSTRWSCRPTATWRPIWRASTSCGARRPGLLSRPRPGGDKPQQQVRALIGHRMQRERQILKLVGEGRGTSRRSSPRRIPGSIRGWCRGRRVGARASRGPGTRGLVARAGKTWTAA